MNEYSEQESRWTLQHQEATVPAENLQQVRLHHLWPHCSKPEAWSRCLLEVSVSIPEQMWKLSGRPSAKYRSCLEILSMEGQHIKILKINHLIERTTCQLSVTHACSICICSHWPDLMQCGNITPSRNGCNKPWKVLSHCLQLPGRFPCRKRHGQSHCQSCPGSWREKLPKSVKLQADRQKDPQRSRKYNTNQSFVDQPENWCQSAKNSNM